MSQQSEKPEQRRRPGRRARPANTPRRTARSTPSAAPGRSKKQGAYAVKAKATLIPREASADEAFRLTLQHCKWHLLANIPAVQDARDVEGLHQLRVALRRLRVSLAAFGAEFRTPPIEALRMRAKILGQGLAPARDMDVFLDDLFEPAAAANGSVEAFTLLRTRAQAARQTAWDRAVREVSGLAFQTFLHDLGEAIDQRLWYLPTQGDAIGVFDAPARDLADAMLARRMKVAKKRARKLESLSEPERHMLRIALKKLRYSAEFFASLYPQHEVKPFLKRMNRMQDILGLLQDVAVARKILKELVEEPGADQNVSRADVTFAAGIVYGWHLDRAASAWADAVKSWKRFARTEPFWANS